MVNSIPCYCYNSAIVRKPSPSVVNGLRADDRGNPDYDGVKKEHEVYIDILKSVGMDVIVLPELEAYPDSIFVEDPALVFTEGAVMLRPGAPSRLGESKEITSVLKENFDTVFEIKEGFADGGDILVTSGKVMIGLSARTDDLGAQSLIKTLKMLDLQGEIVNTPKGVLHFKTDCSLLDEETVLVTDRMEKSDIFKGFKTVVLPVGEEPAANALRINDSVLVSAQYNRTAELLDKKGYCVVTVKTTEIEKIDAGMSCMSLRWFKR